MLAGHDEGGGTVIEEMWELDKLMENSFAHDYDIKKFVEFYGMSSETAQNKHHGGINEYRSSEGRTVKIPYRGPVEATVRDILGGLRSACTYVGAPSLKQLSKCTTFVRCTQTHNTIYERNTVGK